MKRKLQSSRYPTPDYLSAQQYSCATTDKHSWTATTPRTEVAAECDSRSGYQNKSALFTVNKNSSSIDLYICCACGSTSDAVSDEIRVFGIDAVIQRHTLGVSRGYGGTFY